jgi:hypothetical protein
MKLPVELQAGEVVDRTFRRHWMYAYPKLAGLILLSLLPPIVLLVVVSKTAGLGGLAGKITFAIVVAWLIYGLFWRTYFAWYRYQNDLWIMTNQRLIDSLKTNWFSHSIASTDLVNIQDIGVVRSGVLATWFNFGHVQCETAGQKSQFILSGIPKPSEVLGAIDAARDAARREANQRGVRL